MEGSKKTKMIYRYLGNSGLRVSVLSWGNWLNTKDETGVTYETVKLAYENGINFFDTAEIYGMGQGESNLGEALKKLGARREELVISTKILKVGDGVNDSFLSRKHIIEGVNNSLKRLQLDYIDVVFCHRPDLNTPMEETCRAMNWVIEQGKAFYWGTSEWSPSQIGEAHTVCEKLGLIKPIVEQCQYNMLSRQKMEGDYVHLFRTTKMGTTVFSPLYGGVLTGKYINEKPKGSRFDTHGPEAYHNRFYYADKEFYDAKLLKLKAIAERHGFSLTQLALAWVIRNTDVSTCIVGASKPEQLSDNIKSLDLLDVYDNNLEQEIEAVLGNAPAGEMDYLVWKPLPNRRSVLLGINSEEKKPEEKKEEGKK